MKKTTLIELRDTLTDLIEDGADANIVLVHQTNYGPHEYVGYLYPWLEFRELAYNDHKAEFEENPKDKSKLMKVLQIC